MNSLAVRASLSQEEIAFRFTLVENGLHVKGVTRLDGSKAYKCCHLCHFKLGQRLI